MNDNENNKVDAIIVQKEAMLANKGSLASKVRALSEAGFSDAEIDRILSVEDQQEEAKRLEYNEQVEDSIQFVTKENKKGIFLGIAVVAVLCFFFAPGFAKLFEHAPAEVGIWLSLVLMMLSAVIYGHIKTLPFLKGKAGFFLKR